MIHLKKIVSALPNALRNYVAQEVLIGFIEGVMMRADIKEINEMINNDVYNLIPNDNPKIRSGIKRIKPLLQQHENVLRENLTVENILSVIYDLRIDIYSLIINHPKGKAWVKRAAEETLKTLLS